ncbi:hypothetical protein [Galbibacter orientalis]|uniref:hypothetical protein n=1 Tax=Galbibacter orientalis TaxID=453852 RepID=UPI0030810C0E
MQLYKSRSFGDFFSDTFTFLKENGKHFYKNYFIINGIFIIPLMVMIFFFFRFYNNIIFSDFTTGSGDPFTNYIDENIGTVLIFGSLFFILGLLLGVINYAYTPIYFLLFEKHGGKNFTKNDLINELKTQLGKIFIFLLAGFLIAIPTFIATLIICGILAVTIIGIPLLLIVFAWLAQFYFIAFIAYLQTDKGVFDCFSYSFNLSFKKFWSANGCVALFYIIIQTVQTIITIIPYSFLIGSFVLGAENGSNTNEQTLTAITLMTITYMVAFFINLIMVTVLQMNESIIYFSLKEETENINTKSVIDEIGSY